MFLQLLGLRVQAAAAAARGRGQPLPEGLEGRPALRGTEDDDGVVLHIVEALDGRGSDIQERVLVLRQTTTGSHSHSFLSYPGFYLLARSVGTPGSPAPRELGSQRLPSLRSPVLCPV